MAINIYETPDVFLTKTNHENPPHNKIIFEEYFYNWFINNNITTDRVYLPIFWTNYNISRNFGSDDMSDIKIFLSNLDKNKKYFTIVQYADGILQNIDELDIKIFGCGGGGLMTISDKNIGYPTPLVCQPNPNINVNKNRDILCSFVGVIRGRHKVREKMQQLLKGNGFLISERLTYNKFTDIMERSIFSLCPRGYGKTSFRICESLQHQSIPIYIYDTPWIPFKDVFDFNEIGILIHESDINKIPDIIKNKTSEDIKGYVKNGKEVYEKYFSFDGLCQQIIENL